MGSRFHEELEQLKMAILRMTALTERALENALQSGPIDDGDEIHAENHGDQDQRRSVLQGPRGLDFGSGDGQHIDVIGQRHNGIE